MKKIICATALCLASMHAQAVPKSIFLQLNKDFREADTRRWLQQACDNNNGSDPDVMLTNLVIQEATYPDGQLREPQLSVAEEYFHCFKAVFFGVSHMTEAQWKDWPKAPNNNPADDNPGTQYDEGIKNAEFRQANIDLAKLGARGIKERFKNQVFHWYISQESNLNYLKSSAVLDGYKIYLSQVSDYLYSLTPHSILWSPSFQKSYASLGADERETLTAALASLFTASPRINRLEFQDFIGQASTKFCEKSNQCDPNKPIYYPVDYRNTVSYYGLLQQARVRSHYTLTNLMVNMEMFVTQRPQPGVPPLALSPGDPLELHVREQKYAENSIPIGASFEIRYWYLANYGP